jgi:hypothetical protein
LFPSFILKEIGNVHKDIPSFFHSERMKEERRKRRVKKKEKKYENENREGSEEKSMGGEI